MTVDVTNSFNGPFFGDGAVTDFPFTFRAMAAEEIQVVSIQGDIETVLPTSDYSAVISASGGTVTFNTAPATDSSVQWFIKSNPDFTQDINYSPGSDYSANSTNNANDRSAIRDIAIKSSIDRSIKVPLGQAALDVVDLGDGQVAVRQGDRLVGVDQGSFPAGPTGPANSTYPNIAAMKAASVTNLSYTLVAGGNVDGDFLYETSNAPYVADDVNIIKLDSVDLATGALVRSTEQTGKLGSTLTPYFYTSERTPFAKQFGCKADDSTDDAAAFSSMLTNRAGKAIKLDRGIFKLNSVQSIPAAGITIEGLGEDSILEVGTANQNILDAIAVGKINLLNCRLRGDGTATSSAEGIGLRMTTAGDVLIDTVWLENFGFAGISILADATARQDIMIRNIKAIDGKNPTAGNNADILAYGVIDRFTLENFTSDPDSGDPVAGGLALAQTAAAREVTNVSVRGFRSDGHSKVALGISNENPDTTFQTGKIIFDDVQIRNSGWSGIKTKNTDFVMMSNILIEGAEAGTPEVAGSLQGSVFINGSNSSQISNVQVINGGTDGVRYVGRETGSGATGVGRARHHISGLDVSNTDEDGLYIGQNMEGLTCEGLIAYDVANGISVNSSAGLASPKNITLNSPIVRRTTGNNDGILITGTASEKIGLVTINSPDIAEAGGFGIQASHCDNFNLNGGTIVDSGQGGVNTAGVRISNCARSSVLGVQSTNDAGSTQTFGLSYGGGNTDVIFHHNDLRGNATDGVSLTVPSLLRAADNLGWLEGSATYNVPSVAAGAMDSTTVTVSGLATGDMCEASLSGTPSGLIIGAQATAANTATVTFFNPTASAIDPANAVLRVFGKKGRGTG